MGVTLTLDGGVLLLGEVERRRGLLRQFATCFQDHRNSALIEHSVEELVLYRKSRMRSSSTARPRGRLWGRKSRTGRVPGQQLLQIHLRGKGRLGHLREAAARVEKEDASRHGQTG